MGDITHKFVTHGPLKLKFGPLRKTEWSGPNERLGWGAMGFRIAYQENSLDNLGNTLLHQKEWSGLKDVDLLMLPIGGRKIGNTMNEDEALEAVSIIKPKQVIPTHYDCPALFSRKYNPARVDVFKKNMEKTWSSMHSMRKGQSMER